MIVTFSGRRRPTSGGRRSRQVPTTAETTMLLLIIFYPVLLFLRAKPTVALTSSQHLYAPTEIDVESPLRSAACDYHNSLVESGYAGNVRQDSYVVDYKYRLLLNSTMIDETDQALTETTTTGTTRYEPFRQPKSVVDISEQSLQNVILKIEFEVASFMLKESSAFQNEPCDGRIRRHRRRKLRTTEEQNQQRQRRRTETVNIGLTIGPDDEIQSRCQTSSTSSPDLLCYEVQGHFQVYTVGSTSATSRNSDSTTIDVEDDHAASKQEILNELKRGINDGWINPAHQAIVNLTYLDDFSSSASPSPPEPSNEEEDEELAGVNGEGVQGENGVGDEPQSTDTIGDDPTDLSTVDRGTDATSSGNDRLVPPTTITYIVVATVGSFLLAAGFIFLRRRSDFNRTHNSPRRSRRSRRSRKSRSSRSSNRHQNNNNDAVNTSISSLNCISRDQNAIVDTYHGGIHQSTYV